MTTLTHPRVLRVEWIDRVAGRGRVFDAGSGEDVSDQVPLREGLKLLESQPKGIPVEIDIYLLRDGRPFLTGPETVATRRCVVSVERHPTIGGSE
jgi:hypothetical protein